MSPIKPQSEVNDRTHFMFVFYKPVCDNLYGMIYERLIDLYCNTEIRYKMMKRCPNLEETVPLKNIASFLDVISETVSHIRRK